jgi:isoleucyl-tRNA synthetase
MDQTRGWFYTLLAVSILLGRGLSYRNVVSLGLILDKNGQKMSKSKGNVVDPWQIAQKYGIDALRWYFYTINPPGEPKKFDENDLAKTLRKIFMLAYNSYAFYQLNSESKDRPIPILDKWIIARLNQVVESATANLEKYNIGEAAKLVEELVDDLSRWYIRRSRKNASPKTLKLVLEEIAKLMAPFAPFFSEALYKSLVVGNKLSVHLVDWPKADKKLIDKKLLEAMAEARRLASLALAEREKAGIKVRQPLASLKIKSKNAKLKTADKELLEILADEVNVKEVVFDNKINPPAGGELELDTIITPELKAEGVLRELARAVQGLRHDAKYQPKDKIVLMLELPKDALGIIEASEATLKQMVNAKQVVYKKDKFDAELETKLDDQPTWIGVRKI